MSEKESKNRKFYDLSDDPNRSDHGRSKTEDDKKEKLCEYICDNIIGKDTTFLSPFGRKKILYCDYTASGRSLSFIEEFIKEEVLCLYGNTHTTTSVTSLQTTLYR